MGVNIKSAVGAIANVPIALPSHQCGMLAAKLDNGIFPTATRLILPTMADVAQAAKGALKIKAAASRT
jgi:hypothetical protein